MNAISSRMSESLKNAATAALIALVSVSVALPVSAQQAASAAAPAAKATVPTAKPVVPAEEEEAAPAPKKPGQEGIKVHGHWVMDLKDKDGKVIEHRDFQNSLDRNNGTNLIIDLLTGVVVGGNMEIDAIKTASTGTFGGGGVDYSMFPAGTNVSSATCTAGTSGFNNSRYCFNNMTTTIQHDPVDSAGSMILHGQFTAAADVVIDTVQTRNGNCFVTSGDFGPAQCAAGTNLPQYAQSIFVFTGTGITPLTVLSGQTLAITVTISFS